MKVKEMVDELYDHKAYKDFVGEYPDAFLSAGFFILDVKEKSEKVQLDFFIPSKKRVAAFEFPFTEAKIFDDAIENMSKLDVGVRVDLDHLVDECNKIIVKNNSSLKPTKIIAILKEGSWNVTAMDDMLGIVRIRIDAHTGEVKDFSKGSLMDFMGIKKGKK